MSIIVARRFALSFAFISCVDLSLCHSGTRFRVFIVKWISGPGHGVRPARQGAAPHGARVRMLDAGQLAALLRSQVVNGVPIGGWGMGDRRMGVGGRNQAIPQWMSVFRLWMPKSACFFSSTRNRGTELEKHCLSFNGFFFELENSRAFWIFFKMRIHPSIYPRVMRKSLFLYVEGQNPD